MIEKLLNDTSHHTLNQQSKDQKGSSEGQKAGDTSGIEKEARDKEMVENNDGE